MTAMLKRKTASMHIGVLCLCIMTGAAIAQEMPQDNWYFERMWGSLGSAPGQFSNPSGIAVDGDGLVYVADSSNDRIQVFQPDATFVRSWGSYGSTTGKFNGPDGIAVDGDGLVYVADSSNNRIQVGASGFCGGISC